MLRRKEDIANQLCSVLFAVAAVGFALLYFRTSLEYPYYAFWDMDLTTALDMLLLRDGRLPAHVNHTGVGLYAFYSAWNWAAGLSGLTSLSGMGDLQSALNPLVPVAELVSCMRLGQAFLALATLFALWFLFVQLWSCNRWTALGLFCFLGFWEALLFQSIMIRSCGTAYLCWVLAMLLLMAATRATPLKGNAISPLWPLFGAGIFLGLAYCTRIQGGFLLPLSALFFLLCDTLQPRDRAYCRPVCSSLWIVAGVPFAALVFYTACYRAAWGLHIPCDTGILEGVYHWCGYEPPEYSLLCLPGVGLGIMLLIPAVLAPFLMITGRSQGQLFHYSTVLGLVGAGFVASLMVHFLLLPDLDEGWRYLLTDFKLAFQRKAGNQFFEALWQNREALTGVLWHFKMLFGACCVLVMTLVLGWRKRWLRLTGHQMLLLLGMWMIASLNLLVAVRSLIVDLLWVQGVFGFLFLLQVGVMLARVRAGTQWLRTLAAVLLLAVFAAQVQSTCTLSARVAMGYNLFGWKDFWFFNGVYGGHKEYSELMAARYPRPQDRLEAQRQAMAVKENREALDLVYVNQDIPLTHLGVIAPGFPVSCNDLDFRIQAYSPELASAMVVDHGGLPLKGWVLAKDRTRKIHNDMWDKSRAVTGPAPLAILIRPDLDIMLFCTAADRQAMLDLVNDYRFPIAEHVPWTIEVREGGERVLFYGMRFLNYAEVPLDQLSGPFFSVIRKYREAPVSGAPEFTPAEGG